MLRHRILQTSGELKRARLMLQGPQLLALVPAATLCAYWLYGEAGLLLMAVGVPAILALTSKGVTGQTLGRKARDHATGLLNRDSMEQMLDNILHEGSATARATVCFLIEIDDFRELSGRHGPTAGDRILRRAGERLGSALRDADIVARIGDSQFAVALSPVSQIDLETSIQLSARLQAAVEEPISLDAISIYASASIGFCLSTRDPDRSAVSLLSCARIALTEAQRVGPSTIRAYSSEMRETERHRHALMDEVCDALENDEIAPWYQPQISTDTGQVSGFEALARWTHPHRGIIAPAEFLTALEQAGKLERLGEIILAHALHALHVWDRSGLGIPCVGVNFSAEELRNPKLIEKVKWELDRHDLEPHRLCIEVLETVVAKSPDDATTRNINGLAKLGCQIDLDDFGTGHASISSIRRFAVTRLKIDRTFVMKADRDSEQQRMIAAILSMAERLGLGTLAEGVETAGEHAMLSQLGCDHVQGFGIARPMPFDQIAAWTRAHNKKIGQPPRIGRQTG